MKKLLLETSFSKIYIIVMIIITLLILGGYFSYAMFTVSKERDNAISIVTGNLTYKLEVDGEETNTLTVESNSSKEFIVTLSNPNNRTARFNFYYEGNLASGVTIGYETKEGFNIPPSEIGTNLEGNGTAGSSNIYSIRVINNSSSSISITLGVGVGLDYNDLALPGNCYLFKEIQYPTIAEVVLAYPGPNGDTYDDGYDTFIIGENPDNYIWYSGKLWRAVSVNNEEKTVKLVTQWNISSINYSSGSTDFAGSYMEEWLNDTSVDGFLGNLREPENFIVMDALWDATEGATSLGSITRPNGASIVTDAVGLLNMYEYQESFIGTTYSSGYLNNGLVWWTLTPYNMSGVWYVSGSNTDYSNSYIAHGVRPSIILKSSVKIVSGDGTIDNPYRLNGDNDTNLFRTLLSNRYSGEYLSFGIGDNNLYRIVSHENGLGTKITSAEPLKDSGSFRISTFGDNVLFSSTNTIGTFLNEEYLTSYVGNDYINMIEDSTTWYLGTVGDGASYKLAKYTDVVGNTVTPNVSQAKVGLLRMGELLSGQFSRGNTYYWTLTPYSSSLVRNTSGNGNAYYYSPSDEHGIRPSLNLKSNVVITSGDGTLQNPFQIALE